MKITRPNFILILMCLFIVLGGSVNSPSANAGWRDKVDELKNNIKEIKNNKAGKLSKKEIARGIKEALHVGTRKAVDKLGKNNGFYKDALVRIPMPEKLAKVDKLMRKIGQKKLMNRFVKTMNHAAEQAVKSTFDILADAIRQITISDAVGILSGNDNAATDYFRNTKNAELQKVILPIVKAATKKTGVTSHYKKILKKTRKFGSSFSRKLPDIDEYVTQKTLKGLYHKIAKAEKDIRNKQSARTSKLLRKVFGKK